MVQAEARVAQLPQPSPNTWIRINRQQPPTDALTDRIKISEALQVLPLPLQAALNREGVDIRYLKRFAVGEHGGKYVVGAIYNDGFAMVGKYAEDASLLAREHDGLEWARVAPGIRRRVISPFQDTPNLVVTPWFLNEGSLRDLVLEGKISTAIAKRIRRRHVQMNIEAWDGQGKRAKRARQKLEHSDPYSMQYRELGDMIIHSREKAQQLAEALSTPDLIVRPEDVLNANIVFQDMEGQEIFAASSISAAVGDVSRKSPVADERLLAIGNLDLATKNTLLQKYRFLGMPIPFWWKWRDTDWEMVGNKISKAEALAVGMKQLVISEGMLPSYRNIRYEQGVERNSGRIVIMVDGDTQLPENILQIEEDGWRQMLGYARRNGLSTLPEETAYCLYWNYLHAALYSKHTEVPYFSLKRAQEWRNKYVVLQRERMIEETEARRGRRMNGPAWNYPYPGMPSMII